MKTIILTVLMFILSLNFSAQDNEKNIDTIKDKKPLTIKKNKKTTTLKNTVKTPTEIKEKKKEIKEKKKEEKK